MEEGYSKELVARADLEEVWLSDLQNWLQHAPKTLNIVKTTMILHTSGVQVGTRVTRAPEFRV